MLADRSAVHPRDCLSSCSRHIACRKTPLGRPLRVRAFRQEERHQQQQQEDRASDVARILLQQQQEEEQQQGVQGTGQPGPTAQHGDEREQQQQQQVKQQQATPASWLSDPLNNEIMSIALPMLATLAADPIAGLVDTAYMGRLGATQLAGVGVALSVFNTTTKLFNVPLLSVTTSSVAAAAGRAAAERAAAAAAVVGTPGQPGGQQGSSNGSSNGNGNGNGNGSGNGTPPPRVTAPAAAQSTSSGSSSINSSSSSANVAAAAGPSPGAAGLSSAIASSALIAAAVGVVQALLLLGSSSWAARLWGVTASSPLWHAAQQFLGIRALGAPVTVLLLVTQGAYRGLADTRTPFFATLAANVLNVVLGWGLIFGLGLGIRGAALATVVSQFLPLCWLFAKLQRRYGVAFADSSTLRSVVKLFAPTGYLVLRTSAITFTYAIATGLTARAGPAAAACHQVCFQVWLASSLMADSLAVACQTSLAKNLALRDTSSARKVVDRCVSMAGLLGLGLALVLALGRGRIPGMFTSDPEVLALVAGLLPVVVASQPINALAFVWDGVLFGAGGFRFSSLQMALCALPAVAVMNAAPRAAAATAEEVSALTQLQWVWAGLVLVMACRAGSIWLPYSLRLPPFAALGGAAGGKKQRGSGGANGAAPSTHHAAPKPSDPARQ